MPPSMSMTAPVADCLDHLRQRVERRGDSVELPAAVVGDDDAVRAGLDASSASSAVRMPFTSSGSDVTERSHSRSRQVSDCRPPS